MDYHLRQETHIVSAPINLESLNHALQHKATHCRRIWGGRSWCSCFETSTAPSLGPKEVGSFQALCIPLDLDPAAVGDDLEPQHQAPRGRQLRINASLQSPSRGSVPINNPG